MQWLWHSTEGAAPRGPSQPRPGPARPRRPVFLQLCLSRSLAGPPGPARVTDAAFPHVVVGVESPPLSVAEERQLAILTELPFVVPFEERVKVGASVSFQTDHGCSVSVSSGLKS